MLLSIVLLIDPCFSNLLFHLLGSVDKIFNVTILQLQQNLERLKRWLGLYHT
ncbi:MAG: hypothetical protein LN575_00985 [Rickettsia endosymbiont of Gnoriste bilineata]|nr:hypothetical protein [Rickettsia endosymbiont of Gnoriste bilineata]